ncbi:hypothetical protein ACF1BS_03565 [Streptomyces sp. NPDC014748]|uniref:hypothetical protein n=1 Tax=Streptomyces sp. NPDC014748 TaxID=3364905 RepID=UPI0037017126
MTDQTTPTLTPDPDGECVILHLPEITHVDTQVWSADVGLTAAGLAALRTLLAPAAVQPPLDWAPILDLLRDAESYLSALHGSVARHDVLAANLGCAGCELRDRIAAALPELAAGQQPPVDRAALRQRIAAALMDLGHPQWDAAEGAAAVLAVLPEPVDRAAVLRADLAGPEDEQATADQAARRDLIAAALREHYLCTNRDEADADGNLPCRCGDWQEPGAEEDDENDWDSHLADVALTAVPPVDRAAVLREAADEAEAENVRCNAVGPCQQCSARTTVAIRLRRLADEERDEREAQANLDLLAEAELRRRDDEAQQQPYPTETDYALEIWDTDLWVDISYKRKNLDETRERRESYRRRFPDARFRIVRWDETSAVVEADPAPAAGARQDGAQR